MYDTVWNDTQVMAESMAQGIQSADSVGVLKEWLEKCGFTLLAAKNR